MSKLTERKIIKLMCHLRAQSNDSIFSFNTKALSRSINMSGIPINFLRQSRFGGSYIDHESDFVSVTTTGFIHEYEIKTSRGDFKNEAKNKQDKHTALQHGLLYQNYFSFVCPDQMISPDEIDPKYGLVYIKQNSGNNHYYAELIRKPKFLHKDKVSEQIKIKLLRSMMFKCLNNL